MFFCFSHKKYLLRFTIDHDNTYTIRSILKAIIIEKNLKTIFDNLPARLYFIDSLFWVGDFSHLNLCIQSGEALPDVPTLRRMYEKCDSPLWIGGSVFLTRSYAPANRVTQLLGLSLIPPPDILSLNDYKGLPELRSITASASACLRAPRLASSHSLSLVAMATPLILHGSGRVFRKGLNTKIWSAPTSTPLSGIRTNTSG